MCDNVRAKGVTGVPMTVIDGKWAMSGGQSAEVFIQVSGLTSIFTIFFYFFLLACVFFFEFGRSHCELSFFDGERLEV